MFPLITIIVPIYNSEQYIERCIRSLMEQTMKEDIEYLFINDCSPDKSMIILEKVLRDYPYRSEQIKIIENIKNLGVSETRRIALKEASGMYIAWCDSDDWLEKDAIQKMWYGAEFGRKDIVVINYCLEEEKRKVNVIHSICESPQSALKDSWKKYHLPLGLPFQLVKKNILLYAVNEIIPTNQGEDTYMLRYIYYRARTINYIQDVLYHYDRTNLQSITHNSILTPEQWSLHKKNIDKISNVLINEKKDYIYYHRALNYLKYNRKYQYRTSFKNIFSYYFTFRSCYLDINSILNTNKSIKLKTFIVYNFFPLFWLYFHKTWNK